MLEIFLEATRALAVLLILLLLYRAGKDKGIRAVREWWYIHMGFTLIFLGTLMDFTGHFPPLDRFVIIGDTAAEAFLERVAYLLGFAFLAAGFARWLPSMARLDTAERGLREDLDRIALSVEERTMELTQANEELDQANEELMQTNERLSLEITERQKTERELLKIQARLEHLLTYTPAVIYSCRASGDFGATFISDNIRNQTGYEPEDFIKDSSFWKDRIHPDDVGRIFKGLEKLFQSGHHSHEYRFQSRDGDYIWVYDELRLVRGEDGEPLEMVGYWIDITGRKHADEELKDHSRFLDTLINTMHSPVFYKDEKGVYLGCNDAFLKFIGMASEDIIGKTVYDISPREKADIYHEMDQALFDNPGVQVYEATVIDKQGQRRDVIFNKATFPRSDGSVGGLVGVVQEITEHKRAQEALRKREKFLSDILDSVQDGISILDSDFNIVRVNKAMEEWFAHEMPIVGKKCHAAYHGAASICTPCPSLRTMKERKKAMDVVPYDTPEGQKGWLELYTFPLVEEGSTEPSGVIEFVRDITARRRAEEELMRSLKEKEVLLQEIHHRVKNNMAIMKSLLNIQAQKIDNQQAKEALMDSQSRIAAMALVHEKLYKEDDLSNISFRDYVRELMDYLVGGYCPERARPVLDMEIGEEVLGIDTMIPCGLILNELLTNSLKHAFGDTEEPVINISFKPEGVSRYCLQYADNGSGMPEGIGLKDTSGFGLQIVYLLTKQLGGEITMEADNGTRFRITFPQEDS